MDIKKSEWRGFERLDFKFEDRDCILIRPEKSCEGNKWLYKTEYFDAFPEFEIEMLKRGYHVAHMTNISRMCPVEDTGRNSVSPSTMAMIIVSSVEMSDIAFCFILCRYFSASP